MLRIYSMEVQKQIQSMLQETYFKIMVIKSKEFK